MSLAAPRRLPSRRLAVIGGVAAATAGLVASAGLVWHASYSAFSSKSQAPSVGWSAGTVALTNEFAAYAGYATFTVPNIKPGWSSSQCIAVTSSGSLPSIVKLYTTANSYSSTQSLADAMTLTIQQGSESSAGDCGTFTADATGGAVFSGALSGIAGNTDYSHSQGAWATAGGSSPETKIYRFDVGFNPTTPTYTQAQIDSFQGGTAAIGFTWEAQNT